MLLIELYGFIYYYKCVEFMIKVKWIPLNIKNARNILE